jgi:hypothetical protein
MNSQDRLIDAKISILQLAEKLESISEACKVEGIARSSFYEIKKAYEQFGREGLAPRPKRKPRIPNEFPPETVAKILDMTRRFPSYSYVRIAGQLALEGVGVSPTRGGKPAWRVDLPGPVLRRSDQGCGQDLRAIGGGLFLLGGAGS